MLRLKQIVSSGSAFAASQNDCTKSHSPPEGYVFYSERSGSTDMEMGNLFGLGGTATGILSFTVPIAGTVSLVIGGSALIYLWNPGGQLRGDYVEYSYFHSQSSGFWDHYLFYTETQDGEILYLGCEVNRTWISNDQPDEDVNFN